MERLVLSRKELETFVAVAFEQGFDTAKHLMDNFDKKRYAKDICKEVVAEIVNRSK